MDRLLGKVARDVAVASTVVKTIEKFSPPPEKYHSSLTLSYGEKYQANGNVWWSVDSREPINGVWNDFLKWYHGRPQSRAYVIRHREGLSMIRRCDIRRYEIRYWRGP